MEKVISKRVIHLKKNIFSPLNRGGKLFSCLSLMIAATNIADIFSVTKQSYKFLFPLLADLVLLLFDSEKEVDCSWIERNYNSTYIVVKA